MEQFGESLRRERELRGITLTELARATKISPRNLTALEESDFSELPGGVISRGFVRSVSRYMNLDADFWVGEYIQASQDAPKVTGRPARLRGFDPQAFGNRPLTVVLLLILFGVGALGIHYLQGRRASEAAAPRNVNGSRSAQADARTTRPALSQADGDGVLVVRASELRLQIDTLQDAWVQVISDGSIVHEGVLPQRESRTVVALSRIELTTRNASAVVLTLNGETLAPLGFPGETKSITLAARPASQPAPPQL